LIDINKVPLIDFNDKNTIRLIPTAFIEEPALKPLADNEDDLDILANIEMLTSTRQNKNITLPIRVDPNELPTQAYGFGWTYINAAFCYTHLNGNRFNSKNRGAWYASFGKNAIITSQAEVAYHLTKELDNVGKYENITNYREIIAGFITNFYDLRKYDDHNFLHSDEKIAYPAGQLLADSMLQNDANGIIYPSKRHDGGQCLVAFKPHLIQNIRHGATWQFNWNGNRKPTISRAKDFG